jgi:hypothetical protein
MTMEVMRLALRSGVIGWSVVVGGWLTIGWNSERFSETRRESLFRAVEASVEFGWWSSVVGRARRPRASRRRRCRCGWFADVFYTVLIEALRDILGEFHYFLQVGLVDILDFVHDARFAFQRLLETFLVEHTSASLSVGHGQYT